MSESKDLLAHSHSQNVEPLTQGVVTRCACCPRLGDSNTGTEYWTGQVTGESLPRVKILTTAPLQEYLVVRHHPAPEQIARWVTRKTEVSINILIEFLHENNFVSFAMMIDF